MKSVIIGSGANAAPSVGEGIEMTMGYGLNLADYICHRIELGMTQPGDFIRLVKLKEHGVLPACYDIDFRTLKITLRKEIRDEGIIGQTSLY